ncbi:MAG TPA: phenylalanine--tRNA ligase subunit beta, partial [Lacibacter sp.]|nr:phenylalanine--tRNA ligase subunit beta [Lacibacter sp.]
VMRPSMIETGLQSIGFNINRRNLNLRLFEFGKTYSTAAVGEYEETAHLTFYITGNSTASWKHKAEASNLFQLKAYTEALFQQMGVTATVATMAATDDFQYGVVYSINKKPIATVGAVQTKKLKTFDIKQPVFIADINWDALLKIASKAKIDFIEIPKFPAVERDLAMVLAKNITYEQVEQTVLQAKVKRLKNIALFDVFESEKLGTDKKSIALNFVFQDAEKTLTDIETDKMMSQIMTQLEKELSAEIRK